MLAADVVTVALVLGVVVLCVTTAISSLALPSIAWRRRRRRVAQHYPVVQRRVVTGPPATARYALPPAPRQHAHTPDDRECVAQLRDAESMIEHLLEHDPGRLAALLATWINTDHDDTGNATA